MTIHRPMYFCAFDCDVGQMVLIKGEPHQISGANTDDTTTFVSMRSGQHITIDRETFFTMLHNGELVPDAGRREPLRSGMTTKAILLKETKAGVPYTAIAAYRAAFVKALLAIPRGNRKEAIDGGLLPQVHQQYFEANGYPEWLQNSEPPSRASVYRWLSFSGTEPDSLCLVPEIHRRGTRGPRFDSMIENWVSTLIQERYSKAKEAPLTATAVSIHHEIRKRVKSADSTETVRVPSIPTVMRRLYALGGEHRMTHEMGKRIARMHYKQVQVAPDPAYPLAVCEIDHTEVDVVVLDDETKRVLGRPSLTLIIDKASRMIVGYFLTIETPNAADVLAALRHAMLPKLPSYLKWLKVQNPWPAFGLFRVLATDRGRDFLAKHVRRSLEILGVDLLAMPPASANLKGGVEVSFSTMNKKLFHSLCGTTKSNSKAKGDRKPEEEARYTFSELNSLIARSICDNYHQSYHSEIGCSPIEKWNQLVKQYGPPKALSAQVIRDATLLRESAKVTRQGIQIDRIRYNGETFRQLRSLKHSHARGSPEIEILRDPDDVSRIYYQHEPESELIEIPAVAPKGLEGISMRMYALFRKRHPTRHAYLSNPEFAAQVESLQNDIRKMNRRRKPKIRDFPPEDRSSTDIDPMSEAKTASTSGRKPHPIQAMKKSKGARTPLPTLKTISIE